MVNGTVLVCDKNRGLQAALVLLLQKHFSNVATETDTDKILDIVSGGGVDVVVLDMGHGGVAEQQTCLKMVEDIAALQQNTQVVVLPNFGQTEFAMECIGAGAFDFVVKPWNNGKLLVTVRNAHKTRMYENALKNMGLLKTGDEGCGNNDYPDKDYGKLGRKAITLEQMEAKMMQAAIKRNRGNITLAAQQLGITRQTLYNKGKKYKLFE